MPNTNRFQSPTNPPALSGALPESTEPLTAWFWPAEEDHYDATEDGSKKVAQALGRLVYSGMPVSHAIALIEKARVRHYTAQEIDEFAEAARKLLLMNVPGRYVCGILGSLLSGYAKTPIAEVMGVFETFHKRILQGAESDCVYLELMRPPASLLKQSVA